MNNDSKKSFGVIVHVFFCVAMCALGVSAADYYVVPGGTGDYTQANPGGDPVTAAAQKATVSGDVIHLATGTYGCSSTVVVQRGVTLIGGSVNPEETVISVIVATTNSSTNVRGAALQKNAIMRNLTVRGGYTVYQGGGVVAYDGDLISDAVISNCVVENSSARYMGGGGCGGTWYNCVIRNNEVRSTSASGTYEGSGGGMFYATLYDCVITNNVSGCYGGGIAGGRKSGIATGTMYKTLAHDCLIGWNRTVNGGGAGVAPTYQNRDLCQLVNCTVVSNTASSLGGGCYLCTVDNSTVVGNYVSRSTNLSGDDHSAGGGVMYCNVANSTLEGNRSMRGGGGSASSKLTRSMVVNNYAASCGGGTYNCTLTDCSVVSNTAVSLGGGCCRGAITNSTIYGNYVSRSGVYNGTNHAGGGVANCDVFGSTIESNRCVMSGAGAVLSSLTQCRILNNVANSWGGGTHDCQLAKDCLFAGNTGSHGGAGFGGYFENCVMTNNTTASAQGGATYNATTRNCIAVGNYAKAGFAHCRGAHYGDLVYGNKNGSSYYASGIGAEDKNDDEPLPIVNCTVWNNLNGNGEVSRATLTNSIVKSAADMSNHSAVNSFWQSGTVANQVNCISGSDKDPKFMGIDASVTPSEAVAKNAPWDAYTIQASSPCRDNGLLLPGQRDETDCIGNPRVKRKGVDMGALECCLPFGACISIR